MSVTVPGIVLIWFSIYLAAVKWPNLLNVAVFFSAFSATAVINVDAMSFGVTPYIYYSAAYCLSAILLGHFFLRRSYASFHLTVLTGIAIFALFVVTSVFGASLKGGVEFQKISQTIYLLFGLSMAVAVSVALQRPIARRTAFNALRAGGMVASLWGLFQLLCAYAGIQYPAIVFNNSVSDHADMFDQVVGDGVQRIASVAVEPSFLAFSLVHVFAFSVTRLVWGGHDAKRKDMPVAVVAGICLVLTTSTTAYIGIATLLLLLTFSRAQQAFMMLGVLVTGLAIAAGAFPEFTAVLEKVTIGKTSTWSFSDRLDTLLNSLTLFAKNPVFGSGWGSTPGSLPVMLLANVGLIGFLLFALMIAWTLIGARNVLQYEFAGMSRHSEAWLDLAGCQNALFASLVMSFASGFKYVVFDFWFFWGAVIGLTAAALSSSGEGYRNRMPFVAKSCGTEERFSLTGRGVGSMQ